jgi:predicted TIM-barrel fold metal-dependent hydrolase
MIIDIHQHLGSEPDFAERLRDASLAAGIGKSVIFGAPEYYGIPDNATHLRAAERYPDFYISFYYFRLGEENASILPGVARQGYRGLKFICPTVDYDDSALFPVYEQAEALGLVCLFHLGIVARPKGLVVREGYSKRMRPIHLDTIARCFPGLKLIGAHAGNPWLDEMAMAVRWNENLFTDWSGSVLKQRKPGFMNELYWWGSADPFFKGGGAGPFDKVVFGSDDGPAKVAAAVEDYRRHFAGMNLSPEDQEKIWSGNAARLLGL